MSNTPQKNQTAKNKMQTVSRLASTPNKFVEQVRDVADSTENKECSQHKQSNEQVAHKMMSSLANVVKVVLWKLWNNRYHAGQDVKVQLWEEQNEMKGKETREAHEQVCTDV